jgi:hypothetical protein
VDIRGVQAFIPRFDIEFNLLTFGQCFESVHRNCGKVDKDIFSAVLFNEAIPLGIVEPLNLSSGHGTASGMVDRVRAYIESTFNFVKSIIKAPTCRSLMNQ